MTREITITPVLNGFVCKVGCQKVVFQTVQELARNIETYYNNPEGTENRFLAEAVNKTNDCPPCAEAPRVREACEESCGDQPSTRRETQSNPLLR
jgi:hypothetical protein